MSGRRSCRHGKPTSPPELCRQPGQRYHQPPAMTGFVPIIPHSPAVHRLFCFAYHFGRPGRVRSSLLARFCFFFAVNAQG